MKRLALALLLISGCAEQGNQYQPAFNVGDIVTIKVSNKKGQVIRVSNYDYCVRYATDLGQIDYCYLRDYELEKIER